MQINERTDDDDAANDVPKPEISSAEAIVNTAALQLSADTVRNSVVPNDAGNTEGDGANDKCKEAEMHGLLAVISGCNGVDIVGDGRHNDERIDAEGDDGEKDGLDEPLVGLQLTGGSGIFHGENSFEIIRVNKLANMNKLLTLNSL